MSVAVQIQNPFPGLRPFKTDESTLFFGRDDQIGEALDRMLRQRLLAVVGVSGCGKSSLVFGGMIPALEMGLAGDPDQHWLVATMRPGDGPLRELARCLGFGGALAERTYGLQEAAEANLPAGHNLLLVVDQFEELFPFRDRKLKTGGGSEADLFVSYLLRAAQDQAGRVYVLLTMRSDYLGECAKFHGLPEALNDGQYLVPRMTRQQLEEAIEGPLESVNVTMHPALTQDLLNQCDEEPDNLPLLQHLLRRVFEEWFARGAKGAVTADIATRVGGLTGALDQDAEAVCAGLSPEELQVTEILFRRITESRRQADRAEEDRPVRRPQTVADLTKLAQENEKWMRDLLQRFEQRGLLVVRQTDQGDKVDLPHECLCLRWTRLKEWIRAEAEDAKKLRFLWDAAERKAPLGGLALDEAMAWQRAGRLQAAWCSRYLDSEQIADVTTWVSESYRVFTQAAERERVLELERQTAETRSRRIWVGMLAMLAIAGLAVWALEQKYSADQARNDLNAQQGKAAQQRKDELSQWKEAEARKDTEEARKAEENAEGARKNAEILAAKAMTSERKAVSGILAFHSETVFRDDPSSLEKAALLAIESFHRSPSLEADKALRQSSSLVPVSHGTSGTDAKLIATETSSLNAITDKMKSQLKAGGGMRPLAVSADGKWLATQSGGGIVLLNSATGQQRDLFKTATGQQRDLSRTATAAAFSPDGSRLVIAAGKVARVIDIESGDEVTQLQHQSNVRSVAFSPSGKWIATGSDDKSARVMDVDSGREIARLQHASAVRRVAFTQEGWNVISWADDGSVRLMNVPTDTQSFALPKRIEANALAFSPDGRRLGVGGVDGFARIMDTATLAVVDNFKYQSEVRALAFSPDGKFLTVGTKERAIVLTNIETEQNTPMPTALHALTALAISPNGQFMAEGADEGNAIIITKVSNGQPVTRLPYDIDVFAVAFSPDGRRLVTGGNEGTAVLWDVAREKQILQVKHPARVYAAAFSPDGKWLATGGGTIAIVTDVATGKPLHRIDIGTGILAAAHFSHDGRWLDTIHQVSETDKGLVYMRHLLDTQDLIQRACGKLSSNLSWADWEQYAKGVPYQRACNNLPYPPDLPKDQVASLR